MPDLRPLHRELAGRPSRFEIIQYPLPFFDRARHRSADPYLLDQRLGGFVAATPDFTNHPEVVNGASDLMIDVFGEAGRHARAAVGCSSLPRGAAVEVEAVMELKA